MSKQPVDTDKVIFALMVSDTQEQACKMLGVGRNYISEKKKDPAFQKRYREFKQDLLKKTSEQLLAYKGVSFISLKENIDTTTPQGKFMLTVFAGLAQFEREQTLERQREGIAIAKEQGKYKGRQRIAYDNDLFVSLVKKVKAGEMTARKAMEELNMKPNTFYRRVKELEGE